jgi:hypothetical protein
MSGAAAASRTSFGGNSNSHHKRYQQHDGPNGSGTAAQKHNNTMSVPAMPALLSLTQIETVAQCTIVLPDMYVFYRALERHQQLTATTCGLFFSADGSLVLQTIKNQNELISEHIFRRESFLSGSSSPSVCSAFCSKQRSALLLAFLRSRSTVCYEWISNQLAAKQVINIKALRQPLAITWLDDKGTLQLSVHPLGCSCNNVVDNWCHHLLNAQNLGYQTYAENQANFHPIPVSEQEYILQTSSIADMNSRVSSYRLCSGHELTFEGRDESLTTNNYEKITWMPPTREIIGTGPMGTYINQVHGTMHFSNVLYELDRANVNKGQSTLISEHKKEEEEEEEESVTPPQLIYSEGSIPAKCLVLAILLHTAGKILMPIAQPAVYDAQQVNDDARLPTNCPVHVWLPTESNPVMLIACSWAPYVDAVVHLEVCQDNAHAPKCPGIVLEDRPDLR